MPRVRGDVHRRWCRLEALEEWVERDRRTAVLANHDRRDSLAYDRKRPRLFGKTSVVVAVGVDEPRGEHPSGGIDDVLTPLGREISDFENGPILKADIGSARRGTGPVHQERPRDQGSRVARGTPGYQEEYEQLANLHVGKIERSGLFG